MAEKEKEKLINIFDKEYKESDLSDEQKAMVNHIDDLNRKIAGSEFNLVQLRFGRQAFVDALRVDLEKKDKEEVEEAEVIESKNDSSVCRIKWWEMNEIAELYMQIGAAGVIAVLFAFMIMNLIKSQREQTEDLEQIKQDLTKLSTEMSNTQSITIKLVDRMNVSDHSSQRHREDIVKELNDLSDILMEIKGHLGGRIKYQ